MSALGELHDMATSHHRATSATPFKMSANYYLVIARYINQAQHLPDRHKVMFTCTGLSGTEWELLCLEMMPENIPWIRGEWRDDLETIRKLSQQMPKPETFDLRGDRAAERTDLIEELGEQLEGSNRNFPDTFVILKALKFLLEQS